MNVISHPFARIVSLFLVVSLHGPAVAGLPRDLVRALKDSGIPADRVGVVIQDLARERPDLAHGTDRLFNPASVMKLVTVLAALDTFGPAHTFATQVLIDGPVEAGVLQGDLYLRGGGDPFLTHERLWRLLREIRAHGILDIVGDVVIDNSYYALPDGDPGAFDKAPLEPYNAQPAALLINFNTITLRLQSGGDRIDLSLDPPGAGLAGQITPTPGVPCEGWQERLTLAADGQGLTVAGPYPPECGPRTAWLNLLSPTDTATLFIGAGWKELGGKLRGGIRTGTVPEHARPLFDFASPTMTDIVRGIDKYSNNVMARMLFLNLGAQRFGAPADLEKGRQAIAAWLADRKLSLPGLSVDNGSGLSREARLTAGATARLLTWAAGQPLYYEFAASLPALGLEGTQKKRLKGAPETGRAWLKSGSLKGVRNLAGYVLDTAGRRKAVVIFINHDDTAKADIFQNAVLHRAMSGIR